MDYFSVDSILMSKVLKTGKYNRIKKRLADRTSGKSQKRLWESMSTRTRSSRLRIPYLHVSPLWHLGVVRVNLLKPWQQVEIICSLETYVQAKMLIIKTINRNVLKSGKELNMEMRNNLNKWSKMILHLMKYSLTHDITIYYNLL